MVRRGAFRQLEVFCQHRRRTDLLCTDDQVASDGRTSGPPKGRTCPPTKGEEPCIGGLKVEWSALDKRRKALCLGGHLLVLLSRR